jgi:hypothetical protein
MVESQHKEQKTEAPQEKWRSDLVEVHVRNKTPVFSSKVVFRELEEKL